MTEKTGAEQLRTYEQINEKIKRGDAVVLTADKFVELAKKHGVEAAAKEVDVVTTGTFGAMCSSGAFLNFGHAEPPIKMGGGGCWLNDVPAYTGTAAVDVYIGATSVSETKGFEYGGGHVIEDLVAHREVELRAEAYGTDCYPRKFVETTISIDDLNQAILLNPRNAYQHYNAATNSSDRIIYTYMGTLLPRFGNVNYCGAGQLTPLYKDKNFETIGIGTRIFLCGAVGYVIGEGTQHSPQTQFSTIMVRGDLKQMNPRYIKGATMHRYGPTLYVGLGIPIPIINMSVAESAALSDEQITTSILDYGVPSRSRPTVRTVSYAELKSGEVTVNNERVSTSPLSSFTYAAEIAEELKKWIQEGAFQVSRPLEPLPRQREARPMKMRRVEPRVRDVMTRDVIKAKPTDDVKAVAKLLVTHNIDHLPITDSENRLVGIVTSWDIAKALAEGKDRLQDIMTKRVISARDDDVVDLVASRLSQSNISGMPVINNENHVVGIVTSGDLTKLLRGGRK